MPVFSNPSSQYKYKRFLWIYTLLQLQVSKGSYLHNLPKADYKRGGSVILFVLTILDKYTVDANTGLACITVFPC
jgi:hypothetical protein